MAGMTKLREWLPSTQAMSHAAQLRVEVYTGITMRQALGMVVLLGLAAGFIPFLANWFVAARVGAALPLALLARAGAAMQEQAPILAPVFPAGPAMALWGELYQTLAGLGQPLPGWLAGGVSALGEWINWPLRWLELWIVYGLLVMVVNKLLGATNTLQRFYAATGFAAVPLLLSGLSPIPCLGGLFSLVAWLWALAVYVRANQAVTGFSTGRALLAVFLPLGALFLLFLLLVGLWLIGLLFTLA